MITPTMIKEIEKQKRHQELQKKLAKKRQAKIQKIIQLSKEV